jgi:hypothetical protein
MLLAGRRGRNVYAVYAGAAGPDPDNHHDPDNRCRHYDQQGSCFDPDNQQEHLYQLSGSAPHRHSDPDNQYNAPHCTDPDTPHRPDIAKKHQTRLLDAPIRAFITVHNEKNSELPPAGVLVYAISATIRLCTYAPMHLCTLLVGGQVSQYSLFMSKYRRLP